MQREDISAATAWLRLAMVPGIGPLLGRQLVQAAGSAEAIWRKPARAWSDIPGIGPRLIHTLQQSRAAQAEAVIQQCRQHEIRILSPSHSDYPQALGMLDDAPLVLFVRGDASALQQTHCLAMVGARRASKEGRLIARRWAQYFSQQGVSIVSGMALGIDAAAHAGALAGDTATIAVLGSGLLAPFTAEQQQQIAMISARGCIISEFLPTTTARPEHFPRRNRIIAGLAAATLVVEADLRSGSLITARCAAEYGREVLAVPGSVLSRNHAGCHQLIRQGALLVETPGQCMQHMGWQESGKTATKTYTPASAEERKILTCLQNGPVQIDNLAETCGLTIPHLSPILLALELQGVIERLPGSRYLLNVELQDQ